MVSLLKKALLALSLTCFLVLGIACNSNSSGGENPLNSGATGPQIGIKAWPVDLFVVPGFDGVLGTATLGMSSYTVPARANGLQSLRTNVGLVKKILFLTKYNFELSTSFPLRKLLEDNSYSVTTYDITGPLPDLSTYDVIVRLDTFAPGGSAGILAENRLLSSAEEAVIQDFIASSGRGLLFATYYRSGLPSISNQYRDLADVFGVSFALQDVNGVWKPAEDSSNCFVNPFFILCKRLPTNGYSFFVNSEHEIFRNVNSLLVINPCFFNPKVFGVATVRTHPITSDPADPEGFPLISAIEYGRGRVVIGGSNMCFCDTTYVLPNLPSWAVSTLAGADNQQFALNVINWLANGATSSLKIASPTTGDLFAFGENISFIGHQTGAVTNIEWVDNGGVPFAQGLSTSRSDLSPGTHTITLRGSNGGNTASDSITISVIKSIKIKDMATGRSPVEPFKMSSILGIKKFQAFGCLDDAGNNEIGAVKVKWSLPDPDGKLDPAHTMKKKILDLLDSNRGKIGVLVTQNSTATEILGSDTATFVSFFPGNITLKAEFRADKTHLVAPKALAIGLKQPTFSVKVWAVAGVGSLDAISDWKFTAHQAWEKENIFQIEQISEETPVANVEYPNYPLIPPYIGAESKQKTSYGVPSYYYPIMYDILLPVTSVLPRVPYNLFSNRNNFSINCYVVQQVLIYKPTITTPFDLFPLNRFIKQAGWGASINDNSNIIDDSTRSGIVLTNRIVPYGEKNKKTLAHEIGHIIIQNGDEHFLDGISKPLPQNNLMDSTSSGLELDPKQYIAALNLDKKKTQISVFIVEK